MFLLDEVDVKVSPFSVGTIMCSKVLLHLFEHFHADIRRIPNHGVESACCHDLGKFGVPVEGVDAVAFFFVDQAELLAFVEIGADERVAALDVVGEVREGALVEEPKALSQRLGVLAFESDSLVTSTAWVSMSTP